ncbi:thioredoxin family protein [Flavobacterium piscisymbiosum]|uniref:Thioredoxin family protein n=1 Tax=Flavobacterium piscisymbiosum TaxID=2893753 RepID=A0ABS8MD59_9FLAO|nr:thioredoxin family protein [Flavobacterium sp. F-30]MCC9062911.1 thioredoxin family protein [Flavobacterium sp. F-30]
MKQKLLIFLFILGSSFLHSQNLIWKTNMADALKMCDEQRKPLLIFFTSSGISQSIQNEVFATRDFLDWSNKNIILLKLDLSDATLSAEEREQNVKLKEALGIEELPKVCLATASIRRNKPMINKLGLLDYNFGGAKRWISDAKVILNGE